MSEVDWQSPLYHLDLPAQAKPVDSSAGVWANELTTCSFISLRGNASDAAFIDAASASLGVELPVRPCSLSQNELTEILWLSPDEWMIVSARAIGNRTLAGLRGALDGIRSSVVDNSGGYTLLELHGQNANDVLAHTTVYNIRQLEAERVVGTTLGKSSAHIYRHDQGFRLLVRRSFADYIWRYLVRAASPYGFAVAKIAEQPAGAPA